MQQINKAFFIIFIPTLIFLIVFTGFFLLIKINFLASPYEAFSFADGKPSNMELLLIGFKDLKGIFYFILFTALFTIIAVGFIKNQTLRNGGKNRTVLNSLILTFLLALLYAVCKLLYTIAFDNGNFSAYWQDIKQETLALSLCYVFISVPIAFLTSKEIAKSIK